jgi:hypothetical protein
LILVLQRLATVERERRLVATEQELVAAFEKEGNSHKIAIVFQQF